MHEMQLSDECIDFNVLSSDEILPTLAKYNISLSEHEIHHIQNDILKRPPTLTECLLWSIQGSEHCSYKSTKHYLKTLPTKAPHLILGVGEDAAVVSVATSNEGHRYGIAISHESHNHPSQIVPFEGAATGVGGNVRDIACMGATVVAVAESLRFGEFSHHKTRWLNKEVVSGIASYGNALGIASITGDVAYHASYQQNCLVTVVSLGIVREDKVIHSYVPENAQGYALILIGKPTDNSGFCGASFASNQLHEEEANRGAVQEPNAFLERHLIKANLALINKLHTLERLHQVAFKDLGAGGIGCSSVELADGNGFGCEINLDNVHVSMKDLHPSVILCSETQERFMWAVPDDLVDLVLTHYNQDYDLPNVSNGAKASHVGVVTKNPQYVVSYRGKKQVDARANDVTEGLTAPREYSAPPKTKTSVDIKTPQSLPACLISVLSNENVASQKAIYDHYDKQVQGRTVLERGKARAGLIAPFNDETYPVEIQKTGVSLALSQNPRINSIDPFIGSQRALSCALERVAAVGASPLAITDCLCFGNPEKPNHMWAFVKAVEGLDEACRSYSIFKEPDVTLPVVGGNVSLYNENGTSSIAPSPMISCLGNMVDATKACAMGFRSTNSDVYVLRDSGLTLAGSVYAEIYGTHDELKPVTMSSVEKRVHFMIDAIDKSLLLSSNTIEEGGVVVAIALMSFESDVGVNITTPMTIHKTHMTEYLFSETGGFVFEIDRNNTDAINRLAYDYGLSIQKIAQTTAGNHFQINMDVDMPIENLKNQWLSPIRELLL